MDYSLLFTVIGAIIGFSALNMSIMIWAFSKLDGDLKTLANKIDNDSKIHSQRTDQLYMMFIDLLKNNNIKTNP